MASQCIITGKRTAFGNNVAHCNKKQRRSFKANVHKKRFFVPSRNAFVRLPVSLKGIKIVDKLGIEVVLQQLLDRGIKV